MVEMYGPYVNPISAIGGHIIKLNPGADEWCETPRSLSLCVMFYWVSLAL